MCITNAALFIPLFLFIAAMVIIPLKNSTPLTALFTAGCVAMILLTALCIYQGTRETAVFRAIYFAMAAAFVTGLVLTSNWYNKARILEWCRENHYELVSYRGARFNERPGGIMQSKHQHSYFVSVRDEAGRTEEGIVTFGDYWGFHPDQAKAELHAPGEAPRPAPGIVSWLRPVIVLGLIGGIAGYAFVQKKADEKSLAANGIYTSAVLLHKEYRRPSFTSKSPRRPMFDVEFTDAAGKAQDIALRVSPEDYNLYREGSRLRIKYDPAKPGNARLA